MYIIAGAHFMDMYDDLMVTRVKCTKYARNVLNCQQTSIDKIFIENSVHTRK